MSWLSIASASSNDCSRHLNGVRHEIRLSDEIPLNRRPLFIAAEAKVQGLVHNLMLLPPLSFEITDLPGVVGGFAYFGENKIKLTRSSLLLSDAALEDLLIHEITHFIVAKTFFVRDPRFAAFTLHEFFQAILANENPGQHLYDVISANAIHAPYAELVCDVASIILNRNPSSFADIFHEFYANAENDPETQEFLDSTMVDRPFELSSRDFSVHHEDPRWHKYEPRHSVYNRFNQIRSYLWHRWIKDLPAEQAPQFFSNLLYFIEFLYRTERLDQLTYLIGVKNANVALIELMEASLRTDGPIDQSFLNRHSHP